jgi:hypothetical protein
MISFTAAFVTAFDLFFRRYETRPRDDASGSVFSGSYPRYHTF